MLTAFSELGYTQYFTGPVASAVGGAGRAAVEDGEQFFHNPAAVAHSVKAASSLFHVKGYRAEGEYDRASGFTLTDNDADNFFAGAFGYVSRKRTFAGAVTTDEDYFNFSMARFVFPHVAVGIGLTYLQMKDVSAQPNPLFASESNQWDIQLGLHYNPQPDLGLAVVFYNLLSRDEKAPNFIRNQDSVALGSYYVFSRYMRGRADVTYQMTDNFEDQMRWQLGVESKPSLLLVARLGYEQDDLSKRKYATLGLGFDGPRLKMDYFYRINTEDSQGALHGVDFRLPFW